MSVLVRSKIITKNRYCIWMTDLMEIFDGFFLSFSILSQSINPIVLHLLCGMEVMINRVEGYAIALDQQCVWQSFDIEPFQ